MVGRVGIFGGGLGFGLGVWMGVGGVEGLIWCFSFG
jgi:hypothetical protein